MAGEPQTPDEYIASLAEDRPLDVIGETIRRVDLESFVAGYEQARGSSRRTRAATTPGDP
jgi:hypothetical protein